LTLLKGCDVLGVFWGASTARDPNRAQQSLHEIMGMIAQGKIHPHVSEKFPLAEGGKAIRSLMDRKAQGKVVVTM
jgi:NADPH2:quinone reductase